MWWIDIIQQPSTHTGGSLIALTPPLAQWNWEKIGRTKAEKLAGQDQENLIGGGRKKKKK